MEPRREEKKQPNGFKRLAAIVSLIAVLLTISITLGNILIDIGRERERIDNLESAGVALKAELVELTRNQRNTELNTYAIAVKLGVEGIIKPVDK